MTVQRVLAGEDLLEYHLAVLEAAAKLEAIGQPRAALGLHRAYERARWAEITMEVPPTVRPSSVTTGLAVLGVKNELDAELARACFMIGLMWLWGWQV